MERLNIYVFKYYWGYSKLKNDSQVAKIDMKILLTFLIIISYPNKNYRIFTDQNTDKRLSFLYTLIVKLPSSEKE